MHCWPWSLCSSELLMYGILYTVWWHPYEWICNLHWEQGRQWANHSFNSMLNLIAYTIPSTQEQPVIIEHVSTVFIHWHTLFNYTKSTKQNKVVPEAKWLLNKERKKSSFRSSFTHSQVMSNLYLSLSSRKHKIDVLQKQRSLFFRIQQKHWFSSSKKYSSRAGLGRLLLKYISLQITKYML